jgi:hypothetical protein
VRILPMPGGAAAVTPTLDLGPAITNTALCQVCTPYANNEDASIKLPNCLPGAAAASVQAGSSPVHVGTLTGNRALRVYLQRAGVPLPQRYQNHQHHSLRNRRRDHRRHSLHRSRILTLRRQTHNPSRVQLLQRHLAARRNDRTRRSDSAALGRRSQLLQHNLRGRKVLQSETPIWHWNLPSFRARSSVPGP